MNKVILCGRITKEVEITYSTKTDKKIAKYTLAIDDGYGDKKTTDFINIVAFDKAADFAENYYTKGQRVLVEGKIKVSEYKDKDGKTKYSTNVWVNSQEFADGAKEKKEKADEKVSFDDIDDEIPFN